MSLTIEKLNVKLQKQEILRSVSLEIREGEFISLLGASGCGKTTLLKSIAGLLEIESGEICLDGVSLVSVPPEKRGTVIVFQDLRLFPNMTVEQNIRFPMTLRKLPGNIQRERVKELLEAVQLPGFGRRRIREMSGGQMQRVALARALAAEPKVLLLDEPFSGLDEKLRLEMGALVKTLHRQWQITTVLVTHDKREALQMSDRIALMDGGEVVQYDTPRQMFEHPASRTAADYFGKANYISGAIRGGVFRSRCLCLRADLPDGNYEAMIRPFAVRLESAREESECGALCPEPDLADGRGGALLLESAPEHAGGASEQTSEENVNVGVLTDIVFMGETAELTVRTADGLWTAQMMSGKSERLGLKAGSRVRFSVEEERVTYYPMCR